MSDESAHHHPEPVRVPVPPDFPVTWSHPDEEKLCLELDRMHFPTPLPTLELELWSDAMLNGLNPAHDDYGIPIHMQTKPINYYFYAGMIPNAPLEEMAERTRQAEERLQETIDRLEDEWETGWLPEIKSHLAFWDAFNLNEATKPALIAHLDETLSRMTRLWHVHFLLVTPVYSAINQFDELYRDLFGDNDAFQAYRLLQGFINKSLETDHALWHLSRQAKASPEVSRIIEEQAASSLLSTLETIPEGQVFLTQLNDFLASYGQRGPTWSLSLPSWIEDPTPVILNLKDYLTLVDYDPEQELAAQAAERDQAIQQALERLQGYPQQVVEEFNKRLKAAQIGNVLTEDHGFWLDFSAMYRVRRVLTEVGGRLAKAEVIARADDVFYLGVEEIREAISADTANDQRSTIAARQAELTHFKTITPPPILGTDYGPPPDNSFTQTMGKFFGVPPSPSEDPNTLQGAAGSPGKVRGPAKVINSLSDMDKLQAGDILVAETTSPPWTPLFATAAGIVTDTGGILSHCAVVAREYGIPAVVGTGMATTKIHDGQMLEIDGDTGVVLLVSD